MDQPPMPNYLEFGIASTYTIVSFVLYILIICTIVKDRALFSSSFYTLFLTTAFIDLVCAFGVFSCIRIPSVMTSGSWLVKFYLSLPPLVCKIINWQTYHLAFLQYYMVICVSLNRMTALAFPFSHEKIWKYAMIPFLIFSFVQPFMTTYTAFSQNPFYVYSYSTGFYKLYNPQNLDQLYWQTALFLGIGAILVIVINLTSVVILICNSNRLPLKAEINLFIISFFDSVLLITVAVFTVTMVSNTSANSYVYLPYISDLLTYVHSYLMILLNPSIREKIIGLFKKSKQSRVTAVNTSKSDKTPSSIAKEPKVSEFH